MQVPDSSGSTTAGAMQNGCIAGMVPASMGIPRVDSTRGTIAGLCRLQRPVATCEGTSSLRGTLWGCTGPRVHATGRCERSQNAAVVTQSVHPFGMELLVGEDRRQTRVPPPRAGSPRESRVMRVKLSGVRRSESDWQICHDCSSSDWCPGAPYSDTVGPRQLGVPRLRRRRESVAGCGEWMSLYGATSVCVSVSTSIQQILPMVLTLVTV